MKSNLRILIVCVALVVIAFGFQNCADKLTAGHDAQLSASSVISADISYVQMSSGDGHDCVLSTDGSVKCWGNNLLGQVGDGTNLNSSFPVPVKNLGSIIQITSGGSFNCALGVAGDIKCWGDNSTGQLGDGTIVNANSPVTVQGSSGVKQVSAGDAHVCAITAQDTVVCWGDNSAGQLGNGTTTSSHVPVAALSLSGVKQVSAGATHTCAITAQDTVVCWGNNLSGQLGDGTLNSSNSPVAVQGLSGIKQLSSGSSRTCVVNAADAVQCWGYNGDGELGNNLLSNSSVPVTVQSLAGVKHISAGASHTCVITSQDSVECWGFNGNSQLGNGLTLSSNVPVPVQSLSGVNFISAGTDHSCALTSKGSVSCWGEMVAAGLSVPSGCVYTAPAANYFRGANIASNNVSCSGGSSPTTFAIVGGALPSGLSFNSSTGLIAGAPTLLAAQTSYTVTPSNPAGSGKTFTVSFSVSDVVPNGCVVSNPTATFTKGTAITPVTISCGSGTSPTFSISAALPSGLSFNTLNGTISGTPTAVAASNNFTVTATNSSGSASAVVNITVKDVAPSSCAYTVSMASYIVGAAITQNAITCSGGVVVSYSVSPALPSGINLNTSTGLISGTPTAIATAANYTITATNSGGSASTVLNIAVKDLPSNGCNYSTPIASYTLGSAISQNTISCSGGAAVSYSVAPTLPSGLSLNTLTGTISGTPISISAAANYVVIATNSGGSSTAVVSIAVKDVAPSSCVYSFSPTSYTVGSAISPNLVGCSGGPVVSFSIAPALPPGLNFNTSTGVISGTPTAISPASNYTVTATNSGGSSNAIVNFDILDVAPSGCVYSSSPATYTKGTAISLNTISCNGGAVVSYSVSPALPTGLSLSSSTGAISGTSTVVKAVANYTVTATNSGGSSTAVVNITVKDVAPNGCAYSAPSASYTIGAAIVSNTISCNGGVAISYSVSPSLPVGLSFSSSTGAITGTPSVVTATANYTVTATNSGGSSTAVVNITVKDVAPSGCSYGSSSASYTIGNAIAANVITCNGGAVVSYSVSPALPTGLSLSSSSGTISGTPTVVKAGANYTVTATNSGGSSTAVVNITVKDIAPSSCSYTTPSANYTTGTAISSNTISCSGGAVVSYSVSPTLPSGLNFSSASGTISGTPTVVMAVANYTVTATNSGGSSTASVSIKVNAAVVAPSGCSYITSPATYTVGTAISLNTISCSGSAVVSYSVSPTLPSGLNFSSASGTISGTPTAVTAAANYTVTATNSAGSATAVVNIGVNAAVVAPSGCSYITSPATYTVGTAISSNTISCSGSAVVSYSVSPTLPSGLNFSTASGTISGTPTAVTAAANYTVTATNSAGSATTIVNINVVSSVTVPSGCVYLHTNPTYTINTTINANTITCSGGSAPTSFSISPALFAGLSFSTTTGTITGTPTTLVNAIVYTITPSNSAGSGATTTVTATVKNVVPSACAYSNAAPTYFVGTAITANTISCSGGAVVSYSVSPTLPSGLNFSTASGTISGTPTAVTAAAVYTVTATNSGGSSAAAVNITVNAAAVVAPSGCGYSSANPTYIVGTAISSNTVSCSGGSAPTSYSISPSLSSGLNFSSASGTISGTPTASSSTTSYGVTVSNSAGSATAFINIKVNSVSAPSGCGYNSANPTYIVGTAISSNTVSCSGGSAPTSYSISPSLSSGLNFSSASGTISGTPTASSSTTSYGVTVSNSGGSVTVFISIKINAGVVAPSGCSYTTSSAAYTVNSAILPNTITCGGGAAQSFSISPSLSSGLSFNTGSGTITGQPVSISSAQNYTITATNSAGSTTAVISIVVTVATAP